MKTNMNKYFCDEIIQAAKRNNLDKIKHLNRKERKVLNIAIDHFNSNGGQVPRVSSEVVGRLTIKLRDATPAKKIGFFSRICNAISNVFGRIRTSTLTEKLDAIKLKGPATVVPVSNQTCDNKLLPDQLRVFGRYDRATHMDSTTAVRLMNQDVAYPANRITLFEGEPSIIVAESPKSSQNIGLESEDELERDDNKFYYEMVWNETPSFLVSAADIYDRSNGGGQDRDAFDFLGRGETAQFTMTNGQQLNVVCTAAEQIVDGDNRYEKRKLSLTVDEETKTTEQWIILGAFTYENNKGLEAALKFQRLRKTTQNEDLVIVNCNTGKDRSAALIMWMQVFQMIQDERLSIQDITHEYLNRLALAFQSQAMPGALVDNVKNTLPEYYLDDNSLQSAIRAVLGRE